MTEMLRGALRFISHTHMTPEVPFNSAHQHNNSKELLHATPYMRDHMRPRERVPVVPVCVHVVGRMRSAARRAVLVRQLDE